jgi:hypothetical protein
MSMRYPDFQGEVVLLAKIHYANTNLSAEMQAVSTALASDATTHDRTIQTPAAGLLSDAAPGQSRLTRDLCNLVNIGKAGNLSAATMIAAIDGVIGVLSPPGNIDVPYASANASPPVVGTVCSVTQGNWAGTPTSYAYAWYRNGVAIGGATAATYTLVSADTGGKQITAVVTATNATGSTAAPPSNAIAVP